MFVYHGTTKEKAAIIIKEGLRRQPYTTGGFSPIWFAFKLDIAKTYGDHVFSFEISDTNPDEYGPFSWQITH